MSYRRVGKPALLRAPLAVIKLLEVPIFLLLGRVDDEVAHVRAGDGDNKSLEEGQDGQLFGEDALGFLVRGDVFGLSFQRVEGGVAGPVVFLVHEAADVLPTPAEIGKFALLTVDDGDPSCIAETGNLGREK